MNFTILRDNRERKPWEFEQQEAEVSDETLETGDYSIAELCEYDVDRDTYIPNYAVERKSGDDFINSITRDRDRFEREIKRASDWASPMLVIIEEPKEPSRYQDTWIDYYDITRSQIFGTVDKWGQHYNVNFRFAGNRKRAQRIAFDCLGSALRASLVG
jgi:ERCC4-type nuclease